MIDPTPSVEAPTSSTHRTFSDATLGATAALLRLAELYDPALAHRAAIRAAVVLRVCEQLRLAGAPADLDDATTIAAAALADIDLVVTQPADVEQPRDIARSVLSGSLLTRHAGLRDVAQLVRAMTERMDGRGMPDGLRGESIPLGARVLAVADELVGNPAPGWLPSWVDGLARLRRDDGSRFDARVVAAAETVLLDAIDLPVDAPGLVVELLAALRQSTPTEAATSDVVAAAVASAADAGDLMTLFAADLRRSTGATCATVVEIGEAGLGQRLASDGDAAALDHLDDFALLSELRAGVSLRHDRDDPQLPTGLTGEIVVPIVAGGRPWAALVAQRHDGDPFDTADLASARHVARMAAEAVDHTTHWAEMQRMALRDQLTGLTNRHGLYRVLDAVFSRHPTDRLDVAVIMCDVDGLKTVNDVDGHEAGDRLLIDAAAALRGAVRDPERTTVCRMGGDEFCVVIDGGALLTAHAMAGDIEALFERSAGSGRPRSISCGLAFVTDEVATRSELLRAADEDQYQTKRQRRAERGVPIEAAPRVPGDRRAIRD